MHERWLSEGEIASQQGVNADTIFKWITRTKMPAHKLGWPWKFLTSEVDRWSQCAHVAEDIATETPAAAIQRKLPQHWTAFP